MHLFELLTLSSLCGRWSEKVTERTVCLTYSRRMSYCVQDMWICLCWLWSEAAVASWNGNTHVEDHLQRGRGILPRSNISLSACVSKQLLSPTFDGREVTSKTFVLHMLHEKKWPKRNLSHASTEERMQTELSHPRRPVIPIGNTETLHPDCSSISTSKPNCPSTEI